jgi:hypothetical protein
MLTGASFGPGSTGFRSPRMRDPSGEDPSRKELRGIALARTRLFALRVLRRPPLRGGRLKKASLKTLHLPSPPSADAKG